jgi:uncharacterized protein (TIGR02246 family)
MSADVRTAIEAANAKLCAAVAAGDAAGCAAFYTTDACFMVPGEDFLRGHEAIAGAFRGMIGGGAKGLELVALEVEVFGDTATEVGTYRVLAEGGAVADHGKYIVVWKNQDGGWHIHRDIINTSIAAA